MCECIRLRSPSLPLDATYTPPSLLLDAKHIAAAAAIVVADDHNNALMY